MEERIKQRLVGATVLVALAVIFIPIILEGPEEEFGPWGTKLPKPPSQDTLGELEPLALPEHGASEPVRRIILDTGRPAGANKQPEDQSATAENQQAQIIEDKPRTGPVETDQPEPPAVDKGLQSWVVQVASFTDENNALALRDRLRGLGYTAFVEQLNAGAGSMFRVRVGPELKRSDAESIRERIASEVKLNGEVYRYP